MNRAAQLALSTSTRKRSIVLTQETLELPCALIQHRKKVLMKRKRKRKDWKSVAKKSEFSICHTIINQLTKQRNRELIKQSIQSIGKLTE